MVLACDGVSGRFALALGMQRNDKRPMGVAVRRYYASPRTDDDYLESWLELWDGPPGADDAKLLPGYGWIFGMGDGSVNVGLGVLNSSAGFQKTNYRTLLTTWLDNTPAEWGLREQNALGPTQGAGLPMGFNRTPHYRDGVLLVGDSGGSVNPFNGEGIPYAMESGKFAAEAVVQALARPAGLGRERALAGYPAAHGRRVGCLLPARRRVREADRQPRGDAGLHPARPAAPAADEVRAEVAGKPDRPARRRRQRPDHHGADPHHAVAAVGPAMTELGKPNHRLKRPADYRGSACQGCCGPMSATGKSTGRRERKEQVTMLGPYLPIVVLFALAFGFAVFSVVIATVTGPKRYNKAKLSFYECGIEPAPMASGPNRFPVKYFLTAMLFIVFDIEIIFLYPYAVASRELSLFGLVEIFLFIATVFVAYAYVWRRGGLDWD